MEILISLLTLTLLEIILGIDNIVFISIASAKLPLYQQRKARKIGIALAMIVRLIFLEVVNYISKVHHQLFSFRSMNFSVSDILLIGGGLFLIWKSITEIDEEMRVQKINISEDSDDASTKSNFVDSTHATNFLSVIIQIMLFDIIFSIDSVFTAVGMTHYYPVMALAIIIAVLFMLCASEVLSAFINKYPTVKILALSFLLLIGVLLLAEGFGYYIPKGYIYFAISFSLLVEVINFFVRNNKKN